VSYSDIEISNEGGQPVYLYEFRLATAFWRYTSADQDQEVGVDAVTGLPILWEAKTIYHDQIVQGGSADELEVPFQRDLPLAALFRVNSPSQPLWLTIRRFHKGDEDTETPIAWKGTVANVKEDDEAQARAFCISIAATFNRNGLRLFWGRNCPHPLYGRGCWLNPVNFKSLYGVVSHTGNEITLAQEAQSVNGASFTGGYIEWDRGDGILERRGIEVMLNGTQFRVLGLVGEIEPGTEIAMYPGCARNTPDCKRFNNLPNYGGFPHMPGKSPFDGTPVF
jgi:hypothetical protein